MFHYNIEKKKGGDMMKRWNPDLCEQVENPLIDVFLEEIAAICKTHGFAISHEDIHGAFEVVDIEDGNLDWLMEAHDATKDKKKEA